MAIASKMAATPSTWAFLLIPLILLTDREEASATKRAYVVLITLPFMFLPIGFFPLQAILDRIAPGVSAGGLSLTAVWIYLPTAALSIFAVTDTLLDLGKILRNKQRKTTTVPSRGEF